MKRRLRVLVGFAFALVFAPSLFVDLDTWERMAVKAWRKHR